MDFAAEEEMQCIAGTASVTNGAIAGNDAWQGHLRRDWHRLAQTVDGTRCEFQLTTTLMANRFRARCSGEERHELVRWEAQLRLMPRASTTTLLRCSLPSSEAIALRDPATSAALPLCWLLGT